MHPKDRLLLGMEWKGVVFVDGTLPFGLRSAPLLFTALGDAVEWVAKSREASWLPHYINDFVAVGVAGMGEYAHSMNVFKEACRRLGMPFDSKKEEGPTDVLTFHGMDLDSRRGEVRLPHDLRQKLREWRVMKSSRKRDLLSVIKHLSL